MAALKIGEAGVGTCNSMLVYTVLLAWVSVVSAGGDSKAVTTTLTTKWPSTPLLLEASEFLAEESQEIFWDFVELNQDIENDNADTDHSHYQRILERASRLLSPMQLNLLKFSLSLRAYSSTVYSFQQIASNEPPPPGCRAFFSIHGEKSCTTGHLKAMLETASARQRPYLFKGDHKFPASATNAPIVILYAEMGSEEFLQFHQLMVSKANKGEITYVLRHFLASPSSSSKVYLSGYGVELAIKNQEYKAKDDTQVQGADVNATVIGENDSVDEVQGFLFGKLKTLYPTLKEQLKELRKHLVESTNEMAPLKVWQMQDLSFQTAARILAAPSEDALEVMRDLSQNFPNKAR